MGTSHRMVAFNAVPGQRVGGVGAGGVGGVRAFSAYHGRNGPFPFYMFFPTAIQLLENGWASGWKLEGELLGWLSGLLLRRHRFLQGRDDCLLGVRWRLNVGLLRGSASPPGCPLAPTTA